VNLDASAPKGNGSLAVSSALKRKSARISVMGFCSLTRVATVANVSDLVMIHHSMYTLVNAKVDIQENTANAKRFAKVNSTHVTTEGCVKNR